MGRWVGGWADREREEKLGHKSQSDSVQRIPKGNAVCMSKKVIHLRWRCNEKRLKLIFSTKKILLLCLSNDYVNRFYPHNFRLSSTQ